MFPFDDVIMIGGWSCHLGSCVTYVQVRPWCVQAKCKQCAPSRESILYAHMLLEFKVKKLKWVNTASAQNGSKSLPIFVFHIHHICKYMPLPLIYALAADHAIQYMMTSSNGNIFHVTGPLCGEFTGDRWIPLTKASDAELWCFLSFELEQPAKKTIETLVIWDVITSIMTPL